MTNEPKSQPLDKHYGSKYFVHNIPIVFFGTDDFSLTTLASLINNGYNITAVVTKPDNKKGRGQKAEISAVKKLATDNNIVVWQPVSVSDINEKIRQINGKKVGIVVSYGKIIPESTLKSFELGIINVHPSLLPIYRGPSPIETAILNGDNSTGISIIKLTTNMDSGPVYSQVSVRLSGDETRLDLRDKLSILGSDLLLKLLPGILDGLIEPKNQNENNAIYCKLLNKSDGVIDPTKTTAIQAERMVRAYLGFPKTKITVLNREIIITKAHITKSVKTPLDIIFKDGGVLSIDQLIAPSGRKVSASEFINGYG